MMHDNGTMEHTGDLGQHIKPLKPKLLLREVAVSPVASPRHHRPRCSGGQVEEESMSLGPARSTAGPKDPWGPAGDAVAVAGDPGPSSEEESRIYGVRARDKGGSITAAKPVPLEVPGPREYASTGFEDTSQPSVADITEAQDLVLGMHSELERWQAEQVRAPPETVLRDALPRH